jgi:hypothetical protein
MSKTETIDQSRRAALSKLVAGAAFAVPVVASFAMAGLTPAEAAPVNSNVTAVPTVSEWALPLIGVGLGAAALVVMDNKRKEA